MAFFNRRREEADTARLIARLDGRAVKYVTRREMDGNGNPVETVIGKEGRINTRQGQIVVVCNGSEVFRCPAEGAKCGELLSLDGAVVSGINACTGRQDTVVAYYLYYR